jgi:hypothetical protein
MGMHTGLCGKPEINRPIRKCEDNIKMDIKKFYGERLTGLISLRVGISGVLL